MKIIMLRYLKFKMPLKGNENHIQTMYVGAQCVLTDLPGGALFLTAFDSEKYFPVIKGIQLPNVIQLLNKIRLLNE